MLLNFICGPLNYPLCSIRSLFLKDESSFSINSLSSWSSAENVIKLYLWARILLFTWAALGSRVWLQFLCLASVQVTALSSFIYGQVNYPLQILLLEIEFSFRFFVQVTLSVSFFCVSRIGCAVNFTYDACFCPLNNDDILEI